MVKLASAAPNTELMPITDFDEANFCPKGGDHLTLRLPLRERLIRVVDRGWADRSTSISWWLETRLCCGHHGHEMRARKGTGPKPRPFTERQGESRALGCQPMGVS
jgi:hypothetical protein